MNALVSELVAIRKLLVALALMMARGRHDAATTDAMAAVTEIDRRADVARQHYKG